MVEKLRKSLDNSGVDGMPLTDLSKAFECLRHDLLITKQVAHGFDQPSLSFFYNNLSDRTQRTEVNNAYRSYVNIRQGVAQGYILGLFLLNIVICDLFLCDYKCDIASYADDNAHYTSDISLDLVLGKLENSTHTLFKESRMKANLDKCRLLVTANTLISVNINGFYIISRTEEKLLGVEFNSKFSFKNHDPSLCDKANQRLHVRTRIVKYIDLSRRKTLAKTFAIS